jgi:transposase
MFIRTKSTPNSPRKSVQIVESVRHQGKVKQRIVRHVGVALDDDEHTRLLDLAQHIKSKMEVEHQANFFPPEFIARLAIEARKRGDADKRQKKLMVDLKRLEEEQRNIIGIHEVYGELYRLLGFSSCFGQPKRHQSLSALLQDVVMARIANPTSKRATVAMLERDFGVYLNLDRVYKMMDKLTDPIINRIQDMAYQAASELFKGKIDVLFYDCTTLYFESFTEDDLKQNGYSKDCKFNQPQVIVALLVTPDGLPVGYEVFPGSMYEGHTLTTALDRLKSRYQLSQLVFVADRGMLSEDNLLLLEQSGFEYIVGARLRSVSKKLKDEILNPNNYVTKKSDETSRHAVFNQPRSRRLIVDYNEKRAKKDRFDREKAINKLIEKIDKSKNPKELVSNYGYKKYLKITGKTQVCLHQDKIDEDARWDGLHGVITNNADLNVEEVLAHYRGLWEVEESFRINKHDLKIRPIYHWVPPRVKAHLAIAFMAFTCVRHLEYRVALQYKKMSPERIRQELLHVQMSILMHRQTKKRYCLPSSMTTGACKIYDIMGVNYSTTPFQLD